MERSYRRALLDRDLARIGHLLTGRVLEVGAGHAGRRGTFRPPSAGVTEWLTLDRDPETRPDLVGDVTRLSEPDASFDTILCLEVLEYVANPVAALREFRRVLRPGGTLVLSVPFLHRQDTEGDLWRPTAAGLERWLAGAGFSVSERHAQGAAFAVAANVLKYGAWHASENALVRVGLALVCAPLCALLMALDARIADGPLATFSTGYLVVAR